MDFNQFHSYHSELVMYYQLIEGDLKRIYARMKKGRYDLNMKEIMGWSLGNTIHSLKEIDKKNITRFIGDDDYGFLSEIARRRNYWCHQCFQDFLYLPNWTNSEEYMRVCDLLLDDYENMSSIYKNVEQARIMAEQIYIK